MVFISLIVSGLIFYPVISVEIQYKLGMHRPLIKPIAKADEQTFDIVIPKLYISSLVVPNINPYKKEDYLKALSEGVAHAKGSALPGEDGNVFLFAHSTDSPLNISRYNAVFYLVNKLVKDDEIDLYYFDKEYKYKITDIKIVESKAVEYLQNKTRGKTLTLMTCWPPGTTLKRLLITGKEIK